MNNDSPAKETNKGIRKKNLLSVGLMLIMKIICSV